MNTIERFIDVAGSQPAAMYIYRRWGLRSLSELTPAQIEDIQLRLDHQYDDLKKELKNDQDIAIEVGLIGLEEPKHAIIVADPEDTATVEDFEKWLHAGHDVVDVRPPF